MWCLSAFAAQGNHERNVLRELLHKLALARCAFFVEYLRLSLESRGLDDILFGVVVLELICQRLGRDQRLNAVTTFKLNVLQWLRSLIELQRLP